MFWDVSCLVFSDLSVNDEPHDLEHWHNFRGGSKENSFSGLSEDLPPWRSVKHALAIWLKTQKDPKVYCFKQELSCHSDSAAQWRVCWVYTLGGEHRAGMFGGSCSETWVKRGMYVFFVQYKCWLFSLIDVFETHHLSKKVFLLRLSSCHIHNRNWEPVCYCLLLKSLIIFVLLMTWRRNLLITYLSFICNYMYVTNSSHRLANTCFLDFYSNRSASSHVTWTTCSRKSVVKIE